MLTCKLCNTELKKKHLRRDGSMLCPLCGQIYWKTAVEKALRSADVPSSHEEEYRTRLEKESRLSVDRIRRVRLA